MALTAVVLAIGVVAMTHAADQRDWSAPEQELLAAQRAYIQANNAADIAALDSLTADDWLGVTASGVVQTKSQLLEQVKKRGPAKVQATTDQLQQRQRDWKVRLDGDVGFVSRLTAGDHGERQWVTGLWSKRTGRWQRTFSQSTTVQAQ